MIEQKKKRNQTKVFDGKVDLCVVIQAQPRNTKGIKDANTL
jgi:hypothetical protein